MWIFFVGGPSDLCERHGHSYDVAARVSDAVERIADPERLAVVGEWLVEADSGDGGGAAG